MRALGTLLVCWLAPWPASWPAAAAELPAVLESGGAARVAEIIDGDTLLLDDGREVRLVGIQAPKLALGRAGFKPWPEAAEAKAALGALALGRELRLGHGGRRVDRHGRVLAQLYDQAGRWVQGALLARGLARVYSFADNRALIGDMLALERQARAAGRGIWRHRFYAPRLAEQAAPDIGSFQLVEGRVLAVAVVRGRAYLNYGEDWRSDFTVSLAPAVRRRFEAEGHELAAYQGRRLRVRGWLTSYNGPMIEVTHPEQIEVLDDSP